MVAAENRSNTCFYIASAATPAGQHRKNELIGSETHDNMILCYPRDKSGGAKPGNTWFYTTSATLSAGLAPATIQNFSVHNGKGGYGGLRATDFGSGGPLTGELRGATGGYKEAVKSSGQKA